MIELGQPDAQCRLLAGGRGGNDQGNESALGHSAWFDLGWIGVGGGPHFPEIAGDLSYDRSGKVLTIPVKLKPEWKYEFWLNRGTYDSFRSREGVALESVSVTFETKATK